jgi:ATP/maltotriose-dependent transcriptional regulator MalT
MAGSLAEERGDTGAFAPVVRPRLFERLAASTSYPVALVIAPAGYGKSIVLRQYLATVSEPTVHFALHAEHATLLGFLRGFAERLHDHAPHAITTLAGAYERAGTSPKASADLAHWMYAHLESFEGVVLIDDLHVAESDPEVVQFLTALIERTKPRIRWIIASRSTSGLPVGTWLGYRDADVPVDETDLRFTRAELEDAAHALGTAVADEELSDLLNLTEGWPAAVGFALRTSMRSSELRNISALTRDMIYRLLAEQVYSGLAEEERELLEVAIALPAIDVSVLQRAGFDRAFPIVERLRERTAFIHEESSGVYQCHELFREFLRHQSALGGKQSQQAVNRRAARALEESGDIEHAVAGYVASGSSADLVRLLERDGFDLLERARGDIVARAIDTLGESVRRDNAHILALNGALQATAGKFARAESLFRRALARAGSDRDLFATTSLRLASLMANQGESINDLLSVVGNDQAQSAPYRAEALSLMAAQQAVAKNSPAAHDALLQLDPLLADIDSEAVQAKVLHRMGIAFHNLRVPDRAFQVLRQSSDLASQLHLYGIVSRVNAVLSNLSLHEDDDVVQQLRYADLAAAAATKAGDAFALQTALLQMLSGQMRLGDVEASIAIEQRLATVRAGDAASSYIGLFRAERLAWEGRFGEAHHLLCSCWTRMSFDFDKIIYGSKYALFLALDDQGDRSQAVVKEILSLLESSAVSGVFRVRSTMIAKALASVTEAINGRTSAAERILKSIRTDGDPVVSVTIRVVEGMIAHLRHRSETGSDRIKAEIRELVNLDYADVGRLLEAVRLRILQQLNEMPTDGSLTQAELQVLRFLADGFAPKEIAMRTDRSVFTVRAHIANLNAKLGCHGRSEAVRVARQLGLI